MTDRIMNLTTIEGVGRYLETKNIKTTAITPITDGNSNYIWRIRHSETRTSIFKHAEPHLASDSSLPFPVDRMDFEIQALKLVTEIMPYNDAIQYPRVMHYDRENRVLISQDVGRKTLKDAYEDARLDVTYVGRALGRWLALFHALTTTEEIKSRFNHTTAKRMYRWSYNTLSSTLEEYGHDGAVGDRINHRYGSLLSTDNVCICHTDLWPGNIILDLHDEDWPETPRIAIIDWEVTRQGNGATDVGHFAGEAWLLDHFRGNRGLLQAFLQAYTSGKALDHDDSKRVAAQFGAHIVHWPTIYVSNVLLQLLELLRLEKYYSQSKSWIDKGRIREAVACGNEILLHIDKEEWDWFRETDLALLFDSLA